MIITSDCGLNIYGTTGDSECGFAHGFAEGWMDVASSGEVFTARTEGNCSGGFVDQIARMRTENVNAEDPIGFGIGENFD